MPDSTDKALADFEVAIQFDPELPNPASGRELARAQLDAARAVNPGASREKRLSAPTLEETRLDTSLPAKRRVRAPQGIRALHHARGLRSAREFRLGSKVDADENDRLQVAYDRAYEEGRYIDAQEANYIRAIEREPVAALWKIVSGPDGNNYYLPKFTPVEERLDGLKRPLVGKGSDRMIYVKSDDDLAGLRVAIRRPPQEPGDGGLETAAIIPFRWVKGSGVVPLDPPDNLRVLIQLKKEGDHAMLGMSFSLTTAADGTWDLRPEIYTSPKFGEDRFKAACEHGGQPPRLHGLSRAGVQYQGEQVRRPARGGDSEFAAAIKQMPGLGGFLDDARQQAHRNKRSRKPSRSWSDPTFISSRSVACGSRSSSCGTRSTTPSSPISTTRTAGSSNITTGTVRPGSRPAISTRALEHLNKAVTRGPDVAALYLKRGWIHTRKQRLSDAIKDLDQAIRLDPKFAYAYATRSAVHAKCALDDELAKRDADQALRLAPKMPTAFLARAEIESLVGDYTRSLADVDEAIRLQPQLAAAHNLRARLLATAPVPGLRTVPTPCARRRRLASSLGGSLLCSWTLLPRLTPSLRISLRRSSGRRPHSPIQTSSTTGPTKRPGPPDNRLELYRKNLPFRSVPRIPTSSKPG